MGDASIYIYMGRPRIDESAGTKDAAMIKIYYKKTLFFINIEIQCGGEVLNNLLCSRHSNNNNTYSCGTIFKL